MDITKVGADFLPIKLHQVLPIIFEKYNFTLEGKDLSVYEVFSNQMFLPIITHITSSKIRELLNYEIVVKTEDNQDAFFGVEIVDDEAEEPLSKAIMLVFSTAVCKEMFGAVPGNVELKNLFDWAFDPVLQQRGIPMMGIDQ